jgi:hypothetical protein
MRTWISANCEKAVKLWQAAAGMSANQAAKLAGCSTSSLTRIIKKRKLKKKNGA